MPIMTYEDWIRSTRLGITKPRSEDLRTLDAALATYGRNSSDTALNDLVAAKESWANSKEKPLKGPRNSGQAVTTLFAQINEEDQRRKRLRRDADKRKKEEEELRKAKARQLRKNDKEARAHFVEDKANIDRLIRPADHLAAIRAGMPQVKSSFSRSALKIVPDQIHPHIRYEGFSDGNLAKAIQGWSDALKAAQHVVSAMPSVRVAASLPPGSKTTEGDRFKTWFGAQKRGDLQEMERKAGLMLMAMKTRPITFVLRETITNHIVNGQDPLAPMTDDYVGPGVYGYVWNAGNHTGNGMRIIINQRFLTKPCPYEGPAATIYHELTHKVLGTTDRDGGTFIYGIDTCKNLAAQKPEVAITIADCWSYYAISFLKNI